MPPVTVVWFRQDLRLHDNFALEYALHQGIILPIYILDDTSSDKWKIGSAARWWLHHSLDSLSKSLSKYGHQLHFFSGNPLDILKQLVQKIGPLTIVWNRCYEPYAIKRDTLIKSYFTEQKISVNTFNSSLMFEPWTIKNKEGNFFKIFTPFWKHCLAQHPGEMANSLDSLKTSLPFQGQLNSLTLSELNLLPKGYDWTQGFQQSWAPGEEQALKQFEIFAANSLLNYHTNRDYLSCSEGTSRLSSYLHFGEISPRYLWYKCQELYLHSPTDTEGINRFLSELGWREFAYHLLYHVPLLPEKSFRAEFENFPWQDNLAYLEKWQKGKTGIPIIDAAMRQLWKTGYMHNRARMIVASFLTKNLLIPWQKGAGWFWDTLLDADLANNSAGWQWVAGCGADTAPYFRIFNPVTQSEKFDPDGEYIKKWLPELARLSTRYIQQPWVAPLNELKNANITLGQTYPLPIVDLAESRARALAAYHTIKK